MKLIQTKNLTDVWMRINELLRNHPTLTPNKRGFNFRGDYYLNLEDIYFEAESHIAPGLFLEDLGYTSGKINNLLRRYLDPQQVREWLNTLEYFSSGTRSYIRGNVMLPTIINNHKPQGGCISGFVIRTPIHSASMTILSRSAEAPTKSMGDILLSAALSQLVCDRLGLKSLPIRWYFVGIYTRTRTAFYDVIYNWPKKRPFINHDFQEYLDRGWEKFYLSDYEFSYSASKRAKACLRAKQAGTLPHTLDSDYVYRRLLEYIGRTE